MLVYAFLFSIFLSTLTVSSIFDLSLVLKNKSDSISDDKLYNLISKGKVRFNKSEIRNEPCAIYYVESGDFSLLIENCEDQALVEFK